MDDNTLDGNAIGGLLAEVFGADMTMAMSTCGSCGRTVASIFYQAPLPKCIHCSRPLIEGEAGVSIEGDRSVLAKDADTNTVRAIGTHIGVAWTAADVVVLND